MTSKRRGTYTLTLHDKHQTPRTMFSSFSFAICPRVWIPHEISLRLLVQLFPAHGIVGRVQHLHEGCNVPVVVAALM